MRPFDYSGWASANDPAAQEKAHELGLDRLIISRLEPLGGYVCEDRAMNVLDLPTPALVIDAERSSTTSRRWPRRARARRCART